MTEKQFEVYMEIKYYIEKYGFSPTIRELCEALGLKSVATVHYHLKNLKENGYIDFIYNRNRTIRILKDATQPVIKEKTDRKDYLHKYYLEVLKEKRKNERSS